jgi:hypothetical protein
LLTPVKGPEELADRYILYDDAPLTAVQLRDIPSCDWAVALRARGTPKLPVVLPTADDRLLHPTPLPAITVV